MLIVLCLIIYMANYLRIDIRCLWAQSTEHKLTNTSNSRPDWNETEIIILSNIVLCWLNAGIAYVGWRFFLNKNIIDIIISILVHIDRKISESCFLLFFFSENITC